MRCLHPLGLSPLSSLFLSLSLLQFSLSSVQTSLFSPITSGGPLVPDPVEPDLSATAPLRGVVVSGSESQIPGTGCPYLDEASTWRKRTGSHESPAYPPREVMAGGLDRKLQKGLHPKGFHSCLATLSCTPRSQAWTESLTSVKTCE